MKASSFLTKSLCFPESKNLTIELSQLLNSSNRRASSVALESPLITLYKVFAFTHFLILLKRLIANLKIDLLPLSRFLKTSLSISGLRCTTSLLVSSNMFSVIDVTSSHLSGKCPPNLWNKLFTSFSSLFSFFWPLR